jgi:3D (Asp-Asp-Asp) domain-containing protein
MQAHETEHDQEKEKEKEHAAAATEHDEAAHDLGPEPGPRAFATAPAGGATEKKVDAQGRDLGNFLLTHYTFALESDPVHNGSPKISAPGLPPDKKYKKSFLASPYGIKMQGTGLADDGHYIRYQGNNHYAYGVGGAAGTPVAWKTVAVDPSVIKLGSHLDIETYQNKGTFEAKDTGGAIKGKHIDVFAGAVPIKEAYALGTKHSEVMLLGGGGAAQHAEPAHQASHPGAAGHPAAHHHGYKPAPSLAEARAGHASIKKGEEGPAVKFVQEKVHVDADGLFGPHTDAAVKKYQHSHHLEVDGQVGKHTMAAMDGHKPASGGAVAHGGGDHAPAGADHKPAGNEAALREEVLDKAKGHSGAPYSWAAEGPSMFDCSGYSWYVLHTDMHLTDKGRTTAAGLANAPYTEPTHSPQKGDLVFYSSGHISHVTIALGSGSQTIGASGGGPSTHGHDPKAKVKVTDWSHDKRSKSFGSISKLIQHKLQSKK